MWWGRAGASGRSRRSFRAERLGGRPVLQGRLPARGRDARELGLPLPAPEQPAVGAGAPRLPLLSGLRPLKRWRYAAAFGPDLMLCAGSARIGPLPQRWWAVAEPGAPLRQRASVGSAGLTLTNPSGPGDGTARTRLTIDSSNAEVDLVISISPSVAEPIEVVSPSGGGWIWTRKQAGLVAAGTVDLGGRRRPVELRAVIDDSVGYHARHTAWRWSTGVGRARSGERVAWNLVSGVHDGPSASERTVWVEGKPAEVGEARFSDDLAAVEIGGDGRLDFEPWSAREHSMSLLLVRSRYRQPFGAFTGTLPGGLALLEGYGVMEEHDVLW